LAALGLHGPGHPAAVENEAGRRHRGDARDPGTRLDLAASCDDRHACWGGGVTVAAKAAGAVAGIVDGPCTDQLEIEQSDFPLWCRGLAPITTRLYNLGGILNGVIACGGVPVQPGDAILADESGVLVLPPDEVDAVATAAIARQERGETNQERMRGGAKLGDLSGASRMVAEALKAK
jgi:regulator of RNase E activity RraA